MSRSARHPRRRRAMTLLEVTAAMLVISITAAAVVPVVVSSGDAYASAAGVRERTEDLAFAADRIVRLLREAPARAGPGELGLTIAEPQRVVFDTGAGVALADDVLVLIDETGREAPLCRGVTGFRIDYLGADGVTDTSATPERTARFNVAIEARGAELRVAAFARTRMGGG